MHPALSSWRDDFPAIVVRGIAVLCGLAVLSVFSAWLVRVPAKVAIAPPVPAQPWVEVERPFPAFALSIPEAADAPASYAIRRHVTGGGRKDILTLGDNEGTAPALHLEVYRPGSEPYRFGDAASEIMARAETLSPVTLTASPEPLDTKFGPVSIATFVTGKGPQRYCLGFARDFTDPPLQIFGWFCQGEANGASESATGNGGTYISRSTLACALDRFTLVAAGGEPKVTELFARAELSRTFCGQRSPLLAPTPQHRALWRAVANRTGDKH
jgi:hypothetical protein